MLSGCVDGGTMVKRTTSGGAGRSIHAVIPTASAITNTTTAPAARGILIFRAGLEAAVGCAAALGGASGGSSIRNCATAMTWRKLLARNPSRVDVVETVCLLSWKL